MATSLPLQPTEYKREKLESGKSMAGPELAPQRPAWLLIGCFEIEFEKTVCCAMTTNATLFLSRSVLQDLTDIARVAGFSKVKAGEERKKEDEGKERRVLSSPLIPHP